MAEISRVPYDTGWAWMIVVGYFCSSLVMVGVAKSYGILMAPLMEEFEVDLTIASLGMAVGAGIYTVAAPVFVALGQHFTERAIVIFGAIVGFAFLVMCYFKFNIWYIIFMYGIGAGVANACLFGNGLVMIGKYFKKFRSVANGMALSGASVGTFALPPVMEFMLQTYGLSGTYLILGGLYLSVAVSGALYRPTKFYNVKRRGDKSEEKHQLLPDEGSDSTRKRANASVNQDNEQENVVDVNNDIEILVEENNIEKEKSVSYVTSTGSLVMGSVESLAQVMQAEETKKPSNIVNLKLCGKTFQIPKIFDFTVLKMPVVQFYTLFSFLVFFGYFNFIIFMPQDAVSRGFIKFEKAWLVSCAGIGDLIGRILCGIIADLQIIERYKIMGGTCIMCGLQIIIFNFADVFWWAAIHTTLYGFFGGAYVALNSIVLIDMVGLEVMPKALGVILLIQGLGASVGQPIEGRIQVKTGTFSSLNILNGTLMIAGGLFLFLYPWIRSRGKAKDQKTNTDASG